MMDNRLLWVVILVLVIAALPTWPYSHAWGYYPSGGGVFLLLIVVILALKKT